MEALIEAMGLKSINVMAQSMGGDVAFRLVARRPDLFRSLIVAGSSACSEPPGQLAEFRQWVIDAGNEGFTGHVLDTTMAIMFGVTTRSDPAKKELMEYWRGKIAALPKALRPAMSGVMERGSSVPLLPGIRDPCPDFQRRGRPATSTRMVRRDGARITERQANSAHEDRS